MPSHRKTQQPPLIEIVREILKPVLSSPSIQSIERVSHGVSTWVYRVECGDERHYLRILPEEEGTFAPEVRAHQLVREAGVRAPTVLHYEARNDLVDRSIMLTSEIPGQPLSSQAPIDFAREVVREAGRDLARINSIPVDGWGWIDRDSETVPPDLEGDHADLATLIEREYPQGFATIWQGFLNPTEMQELDEIIQRVSTSIGTQESWLMHGDFDITHIYCDDGGYTGIIDFGEIRGMPKLYDLAHHWMHDQERLPYSTLPWLLDGYAEITPLPAGFRQQISTWSLLIALRALNRGLARNPDSLIARTARSAIKRDISVISGL